MRPTTSAFTLKVSLISITLTLLSSAQKLNKELLLHRFQRNGKDGYYLYSGLVFDSTSNLYGTTNGGPSLGSCDGYDSQGCGTVFQLTPDDNGRWTEKLLYSFKSNHVDGFGPIASVTLGAPGKIYGTTQLGGAGGQGCQSISCGTVFELTSHADGKWTEKVLHNFSKNGTDGSSPSAGVILDEAGNLYGTTAFGGTHFFGVVFELTPETDGQWNETVLHSFDNKDGCTPGPLIFDKQGNLYGATSGNCGAHGGGTVFQLVRGTDGKWSEKVLYNFKRNGQDGYSPTGIVFDSTGNLYGTTIYGGTTECTNGCGTVFQLTHTKGDQWTEKVLYSLGQEDGGYPMAGVIIGKDGSLYGTTSGYGPSGPFAPGAVFQLSKGPNGQWTETVLHTFAGNDQATDGDIPFGGLIFDKKGNLYGTTYEGGGTGSYGWGTVFEIMR